MVGRRLLISVSEHLRRQVEQEVRKGVKETQKILTQEIDEKAERTQEVLTQEVRARLDLERADWSLWMGRYEEARHRYAEIAQGKHHRRQACRGVANCLVYLWKQHGRQEHLLEADQRLSELQAEDPDDKSTIYNLYWVRALLHLKNIKYDKEDVRQALLDAIRLDYHSCRWTRADPDLHPLDRKSVV